MSAQEALLAVRNLFKGKEAVFPDLKGGRASFMSADGTQRMGVWSTGNDCAGLFLSVVDPPSVGDMLVAVRDREGLGLGLDALNVEGERSEPIARVSYWARNHGMRQLTGTKGTVYDRDLRAAYAAVGCRPVNQLPDVIDVDQAALEFVDFALREVVSPSIKFTTHLSKFLPDLYVPTV